MRAQKSNKPLPDDLSALRGRIAELEAKARHSESIMERYQLLFEESIDGYAMIDLDGRFKEFNPAFQDMIGYSGAELCRMTYRDITPEKWHLMEEEIISEHILQKGYAECYEKEYRRKDGTIFPVELRTYLMRNHHGEPGGFWAFVRDITERKKKDEALRESDESFRLLFEKSGDGNLIIEEGRYIECNEAALKMTRCTRKSQLLNTPAGGISPRKQPDGRASMEKARKMMKIAYREGGNRFEWICKRFDGTECCLDVMLSPIQRKGKTLLFTTWRDISEIKETENKLRESQKRLAEIIEFLPDATLVVNGAGKVIAWNRAIEAMTGVTAKEMLGKGDRAYAVPFYAERRPVLVDIAMQEDPEAEKSYTTLKRQENVIFGEAFLPNMPPGNRHLSATASVFRNAQGKIVAAMECIRDRTEQVCAEEEKKKMQDQLFAAQKMEAIGTLAGGIAHDFNNVLASMIGYAELARHMSQETWTHKYLEQVTEAGDRAKKLINQILAFSSKREQEQTPVNISLLAREVLELLRSTLPATIEIQQHIAADYAAVLADPTKIHQIIMNLCTNAAHAMREKGGILDISISTVYLTEDFYPIREDARTGAYVLLTVKDNGQGIDPAILEKIYDPFFTTKKPGEGTGLGLSVVYGIVKSCGGVITVQSDVGKGTTFNVYFPCMPDTVSVQERKDEENLIGGHEQILCIDDEESITRLIHEFLESIGYKVVSTTNCLEALSVYREDPHRFDLVITDLTMPQMTGLDLAEKILSIRPDIPIVLCTGYNETFTLEDIKRRGLKDLIVKPIALKSLALRVRRVLDA